MILDLAEFLQQIEQQKLSFSLFSQVKGITKTFLGFWYCSSNKTDMV